MDAIVIKTHDVLKILQENTDDAQLNLCKTDDCLKDKLFELFLLSYLCKTLMLSADNCLLLSIKDLNYNYNQATDINWIKYFPNIQELHLKDNKLTSISMLEFTPNLEWLILTNNPLCCAIDLTNYKYLVQVDFANCSLTELTIRSLYCLEYVRCDGNNIVKFILQDLPKLRHVFCSNNPFTEIVGLEELTSVTILDCHATGLKFLNEISKCIHLILLICNISLLNNVLKICTQLSLCCKFKSDHLMFYKIKDHNISSRRCNICLIKFKENEMGHDQLIIILKCDHIFHKNCIMDSQISRCPKCRSAICF